MMDRRFPNMVRVENAPIGSLRATELARFCDRLCRRVVGVRCAFDTNRRSVYFYRGDIDRGLYRMEVFYPDGNDCPLDDDLFDGVCHVLRLSTAPMSRKLKWKKQHEDADKDARERATDAWYAERRSTAIDRVQRQLVGRVVSSG